MLNYLDLNLEKEFLNKKIVITGASRGLGAAACEALAKRGAKIAMLSRSKKEMEVLRKKLNSPKHHITIKVDLLKNNEIKFAINKAKKFLKKIDIVLHVAGGGFGLKKPLIDNKDLNILFQGNLGAAAEINKLIINQKTKNQLLKIIHIGSIASSEAVGSVGYNVAKSALSAYVKSLGREMYKNKIIVSGILPGGFIAKGNAMERLKKKNFKDYKKFIKERLPRKKMGNVNELLPMLLFLCSKHASMMGGCLVQIDAGEGKSYLI